MRKAILVSAEGPTHGSPPLDGVGWSQFLTRLMSVVKPHVVAGSLQLVHSPQLPLVAVTLDIYVETVAGFMFTEDKQFQIYRQKISKQSAVKATQLYAESFYNKNKTRSRSWDHCRLISLLSTPPVAVILTAGWLGAGDCLGHLRQAAWV